MSSNGVIHNTKDTFLHYIADRVDFTVHNVRFSATQPDTNAPQVGAINITFHNAEYDIPNPSTLYVTLDILHTDELAAGDMEEALVAVLQAAGYTQLLDYSSGTPEAVGVRKVYWPIIVKFRTVAAADYFHRSAILLLSVRSV
jgi:hypothetical protein